MANTHLVLSRIWHSKDCKHVEPGNKVSLDHLRPIDIQRLEQKGIVILLKPGEKTELQEVPGIGEKTEAILLKLKIFNLEDLIKADPVALARQTNDLKVADIQRWQELAVATPAPVEEEEE